MVGGIVFTMKLNPPRFNHRLGLVLVALIVCLAGVVISPAAPVPVADHGRAPVTIKIDGGEVYALGFDQLSSFDYTIVDAGTGATAEQIAAAQKRDQVPAWLYFYQDRRVLLTGYVMPLQFENGLSKKLILMKDVTTCCYGAVPNMNDYVIVTMKGEGVKAVQDVPVAIVGVFHVEQKYENGFVTSLFQFTGEKFLGPKT